MLRTGECNGCAECCKYIQLPLARNLTEDEKRWAELHPSVEIRGKTVRLNIPCSALQDNRCSIYEERPQMCRNYPTTPVDEGCSYVFRQEAYDMPPEKE